MKEIFVKKEKKIKCGVMQTLTGNRFTYNVNLLPVFMIIRVVCE